MQKIVDPYHVERAGEVSIEDIDHGLVLQLRLLAEPCLWCWKIVDGVDDRLVESSWANHWIAFDSRADAAAAGARRLAELARASAARASRPPRQPARRIVPAPTRRAG
jgi:hypothetical protein